MTRHHTKDKGDLAVVKVQADLVEQGASVLLPLTEHAPFDLVATLPGAPRAIEPGSWSALAHQSELGDVRPAARRWAYVAGRRQEP